MGYCRFQNTQRDLVDCLNHLNERVSSEDEDRARARLIANCKKIIEEFDDIPNVERAEDEED